MTHHKVSEENRRGMAPAMFALVAAMAVLVRLFVWLLFGAVNVYCQCASSLSRGGERCAKCGKLLRPLPKKGK
jgi:hypothetical protein